MTELYIDNMKVNLPEDFEVDFYVNNPFFTKKGDYTYDIDLSLKDKNNAKIYNHMYRLHSITKHTNRSAVLIVNGMVIINGTEIILSIEDSIAKIQLVSGNSELNYLSAGKKTLRELDLGEIPDIDEQLALYTLDHFYPDSDFVCCPVIKEKGSYVYYGQEPKSDVLYNDIDWDTRNGYNYKDGTTFVAQPYLLAFIDKVCKALGYDIEENVLTQNEMYRKLIIVNGYDAKQYNKIVPNWVIDDFITEIEKLFNVVFLVNKVTKKIRILNTYKYYQSNNNKIEISGDKVHDNIKIKYDQKESLYITYDNVSYSLPNDSWYKYQELDPELVKKCTVINVDTFSRIDIETYKGYYIFHDLSTDLYFVTNGNNQLVMVDYLKSRLDDQSDDQSDFKIVPSEIYDNSYFLSRVDLGGFEPYTGRVGAFVPVVSNVRKADDAQKKLYEAIEGGVAQDEIDNSNLFISIFIGSAKLLGWMMFEDQDVPMHDLDRMTYPQCTMSPYLPYDASMGHNRLFKIGSDTDTLAILGTNGFYERAYSDNISVNTDTEYVIPFEDNRFLNPMSEFVVDNRKFYCKCLLYKITAKGLSTSIEGTFYAM